METDAQWNANAKLFNSTLAGDIEGVIVALAQGGQVTMRNSKGETPLLAAAKSGHTDICGLLLAHGSNVNAMVPDTKHRALDYAADNGHIATVEALLSWGADVNPQDHYGFTPLHGASRRGHLPCVLALLKAGANPTLPSTQGTLPIHSAAQCNRTEIVRTLLELGCSPDMVSRQQI